MIKIGLAVLALYQVVAEYVFIDPIKGNALRLTCWAVGLHFMNKAKRNDLWIKRDVVSKQCLCENVCISVCVYVSSFTMMVLIAYWAINECCTATDV